MKVRKSLILGVGANADESALKTSDSEGLKRTADLRTDLKGLEPSQKSAIKLGAGTPYRFAKAKALFSQLFKKKSLSLEFKDKVAQLPEAQKRAALVSFANAAGLVSPREVHRTRAGDAERRAITAETLPEKIDWLTLAFSGYLAGARFDRPKGEADALQAKAAKTASILKGICPKKGDRLFWEGMEHLLLGRPMAALRSFRATRRQRISPDKRLATQQLIAQLPRALSTGAVESLMLDLPKVAHLPGELGGWNEQLAGLAEKYPAQALRLAAVGGYVGATSKAADVEDAFLKTKAVLEREQRHGELERLAGERDLLLARCHLTGGDTGPALKLLQGLEASNFEDQVSQARLLFAEHAMSTGDTQAALDSLAKVQFSSAERQSLLAALSLATDPEAPSSASLADETLHKLVAFGAPAEDIGAAVSAVQARISTVKKGELTQVSAMTPDQTFAFEELSTTYAMAALLKGDTEQARTLLGPVRMASSDVRGRGRFARAMLRLHEGDVEGGKQDLQWVLKYHELESVGALVNGDKKLMALVKNKKAPGREAVRGAIKRELNARRDDYLKAMSTWPLAQVADVPLGALFSRRFAQGPKGPKVLGSYEAQLALLQLDLASTGRSGEAPASVALRKNDLGNGALPGMICGLLAARANRLNPLAPHSEKRPLVAALGREVAANALESVVLGGMTMNAQKVGEAERGAILNFAEQELGLEVDQRALALGCTSPGEVAQHQALFDRHGVPCEKVELNLDVDGLLGVLNTVADSAGLVESSKPKKISGGPFKAAFKEIARVLDLGEHTSVESAEEAEAMIRALGFSEQPGLSEGVMMRGDIAARVSPFSVGEIGAYKVEVGRCQASGKFQKAHRSVHVGGLTFADEHWSYFEKGYNRALQRYGKAIRRVSNRQHQWRSDINGIRSLIGLGRKFGLRTKHERTSGKVGSEKFKMGMELVERAKAAAALLAKLKAEGKAPKGIMIMVDGIDAASKTSNGDRLKRIFEKAGYKGDWLSFKAPTAKERTQHWLKRFDDHRPGEGELFFCDRSPLGDYAYNPNAGPEDLARMAKDFEAWQAEMEKEGILVLNFLFYPGLQEGKSKKARKRSLDKRTVPDLWRPMFTFGKREARAAAAAEMAMRAKAAKAGSDVVEGLEDAASLSPGFNDLKSFHTGVQVHERFLELANAINGKNPWEVIPTERRHKGRKQVLDVVIERLQELADA